MRAIAYCSPFVPPEWIVAHGLRPRWMRVGAQNRRPAVGVGQSICAYAGSLMDESRAGTNGSALVLTTTCDQMRYAAAVLERHRDRTVFLLNVPSTWQTEAAEQHYLDELERLGDYLVRWGGKSPSAGCLAQVMIEHEDARAELRAARPQLSGRQYARAAAGLRGNGQLACPSAVVAGRQDRAADWESAIPLAIVGGPLLERDFAIFDLVEKAGGRVVLDGTAGGERTWPARFDRRRLRDHPLAELARAYFGSIPDAFRRPNDALYEWLEREIAARQVRGMLYCRYVWCDLSAIAQRLEGMGFPILWWEIPHRRTPDAGESAIRLPGGFHATAGQVQLVQSELERVRRALEQCAGRAATDDDLHTGIRIANRVRRRLATLRQLVFTAPVCPLPALEMLIAEMLAIHFCSDREESIRVVGQLIAEVTERVRAGVGVLGPEAVRVFWANPVADLRVMNLLEDVGGRVCGTEFMFSHALDPIPQDVPPMQALAMAALADPMVGSAADRAHRICADIQRYGAEALVISRIPGASHCALEGMVIGDIVRQELAVPVVELEVAPLTEAMEPTLRTRLEALVETAYERRET